MAVWAYGCHPCGETAAATWYVAATAVDQMPAGTAILRVRVDSEWRCALLDRRQRVSVEQLLLREAIPSDPADCPGCAERAQGDEGGPDEMVRRPPEAPRSEPARSRSPSASVSSGTVQAAAISMQGLRWVVVLVSKELLLSQGEADLAIQTLAPRFGGVPIVLMAQQEDGSPRYYGDATLLELLRDVPLERMPWKDYRTSG